MEKHLKAIREVLEPYAKVAVAFSGGVDSTLLLKAAVEAIGKERVVAFTVKSPYIPQWEVEEATELAETIGVTHHLIPLGIPETIENNPENRCYLCKKIVFNEILKAAKREGCKVVCDGTNHDDLKDYRPGLLALKELGVLSPLKEAGMTKQDVRDMSKVYGLSTWDKPPYACLLTRIPYDMRITEEALRRIEAAEVALMRQGFRGVRVRHHGDLARIEIAEDEMIKAMDVSIMKKIHDEIRQLGYQFVTLDMGGYKTGCYNVGLKQPSEA